MLDKLRTNSIAFRILAAVAAICILLLGIMIASSVYSAGLIRTQVFTTYQGILSTYIHGLENNLVDMESFFTGQFSDTEDIRHLKEFGDWWSLSAYRKYDEFSKAIPSYSMADGFFLYEPGHRIWVEASQADVVSASRLSIRGYLTGSRSGEPQFSHIRSWDARLVGDEWVFFRVFQIHGCYMGAWVSTSTITNDYRIGESTHSGHILFCSPTGQLYSEEPALQGMALDPVQASTEYMIVDDHMVIAKYSPKMGCYLVLLLEEESVTQGMGGFRLMMVLLLGCAMLCVGLLVLTMYRILLRPFGRLTRAMQTFQGGNWDIRLPEELEPDEFQDIHATFNHMVEQVEALKIDVYEEKIEKQAMETQMLKQQMAPHTFINCLNTIHALAGTGEMEKVQRMAEDLGRHLRYILAANQTMPFSQDLDHARNYVAMNTIRYGDRIRLEEEIDPQVLNSYIPPLLIHTFVENSLKYALSSTRETWIYVKAWREGDRLKLIMQDNGPGYSSDMLDTLASSPGSIPSASGRRIGLQNLRRRVALLYGERGSICCSNRPQGGAQMEVDIPYVELGVRL